MPVPDRDCALFVVVPFYNEANGIGATLDALAAQSDPAFSLVLVDNASTDRGADVVRAFARGHPEMALDLIAEPVKGTGAASDTGVRHAIKHGATHIARTDADCLPRPDWVRNLKRAFCEDGLEFVAGTIEPRTDDIALSRLERLIIRVLLVLAEHFGGIHRRGRQFKYPYILAVGNNLAITADLYLRAGGFPRTSIDQVHEDLVLAERVRTLTRQAALRRDVVVYNSTRRAKRYGYLRTALWYIGHWCRPADVDVR